MDTVRCPFCNPEDEDIIIQNKSAYARFDKYPVNPGHLLIIPSRHFVSLFDASSDELIDLFDILQKSKSLLDTKYYPDGYNIGINNGEVAGQTVMHLHIHLIPRYKGDVEDPRGGVRGVIPEKRLYGD